MQQSQRTHQNTTLNNSILNNSKQPFKVSHLHKHQQILQNERTQSDLAGKSHYMLQQAQYQKDSNIQQQQECQQNSEQIINSSGGLNKNLSIQTTQLMNKQNKQLLETQRKPAVSPYLKLESQKLKSPQLFNIQENISFDNQYRREKSNQKTSFKSNHNQFLNKISFINDYNQEFVEDLMFFDEQDKSVHHNSINQNRRASQNTYNIQNKNRILSPKKQLLSNNQNTDKNQKLNSILTVINQNNNESYLVGKNILQDEIKNFAMIYQKTLLNSDKISDFQTDQQQQGLIDPISQSTQQNQSLINDKQIKLIKNVNQELKKSDEYLDKLQVQYKNGSNKKGQNFSLQLQHTLQLQKKPQIQLKQLNTSIIPSLQNTDQTSVYRKYHSKNYSLNLTTKFQLRKQILNEKDRLILEQDLELLGGDNIDTDSADSLNNDTSLLDIGFKDISGNIIKENTQRSTDLDKKKQQKNQAKLLMNLYLSSNSPRLPPDALLQNLNNKVIQQLEEQKSQFKDKSQVKLKTNREQSMNIYRNEIKMRTINHHVNSSRLKESPSNKNTIQESLPQRQEQQSISVGKLRRKRYASNPRGTIKSFSKVGGQDLDNLDQNSTFQSQENIDLLLPQYNSSMTPNLKKPKYFKSLSKNSNGNDQTSLIKNGIKQLPQISQQLTTINNDSQQQPTFLSLKTKSTLRERLTESQIKNKKNRQQIRQNQYQSNFTTINSTHSPSHNNIQKIDIIMNQNKQQSRQLQNQGLPQVINKSLNISQQNIVKSIKFVSLQQQQQYQDSQQSDDKSKQ